MSKVCNISIRAIDIKVALFFVDVVVAVVDQIRFADYRLKISFEPNSNDRNVSGSKSGSNELQETFHYRLWALLSVKTKIYSWPGMSISLLLFSFEFD